jgi:hypothetical protein
MMFESVGSITNAKNLEDKFQFVIDQQSVMLQNLKVEKVDLEQLCNTVVNERDLNRSELREMLDAKSKV